MIRAMYPGSFDPITRGHLDVIKQTINLFGNINIVIAINPDKTSLLSPEERRNLIWDVLISEGLEKRCSVHVWNKLVIDYVKDISTGKVVFIRGIRNVTDMISEIALADVNEELSSYKTIFIPTSNEYRNYSSSLVKELWRHGKDVSKYVHPAVASKMQEIRKGKK